MNYAPTLESDIRSWIAFLPVAFMENLGPEGLPLIVALHGGDGDAMQATKQFAFDMITNTTTAPEDKFIVLFVEGMGLTRNAGDWNWGHGQSPGVARGVAVDATEGRYHEADYVAYVVAEFMLKFQVYVDALRTARSDVDPLGPLVNLRALFLFGYSAGAHVAYRIAGSGIPPCVDAYGVSVPWAAIGTVAGTIGGWATFLDQMNAINGTPAHYNADPTDLARGGEGVPPPLFAVPMETAVLHIRAELDRKNSYNPGAGIFVPPSYYTTEIASYQPHSVDALMKTGLSEEDATLLARSDYSMAYTLDRWAYHLGWTDSWSDTKAAADLAGTAPRIMLFEPSGPNEGTKYAATVYSMRELGAAGIPIYFPAPVGPPAAPVAVIIGGGPGAGAPIVPAGPIYFPVRDVVGVIVHGIDHAPFLRQAYTAYAWEFFKANFR
jgi:hypothetical protein